MEYRGTGLPTREPRSEPSWPTVIATTARLWFERHALLGRRLPRRRAAVLLTVLAVVIAAGAVTAAAVLAQGTAAKPSATDPPAATGNGTSTGGSGLGTSVAVRNETATWIAAQVSSSAIVACDPAMCAALEADQFPASSLVVLNTATTDPLGSDLVVATAAVRSEFGNRLASVYAPEVIASFGTGSARIDVRAIAVDGAAAYRSSLSADLGSRAAAGRQLLGNKGITAAGGAKTALRTGDVDSRLLTLLAGIAGQQPVTVLAFGDSSPGADSTVPLRSVRITPRIAPAKAKARLRSMLSFIQAQQQPYLPLRVTVSGTSLTVEYAAPSPVGLLSGP
jgi:hypothetical protein